MRTTLATLHSKYIHASLALPCLASFCGADCGDLTIREFTTHEPHDSILAQLLADQPDVIVLSVYIWNRRESLDLVDALAIASPGLKIVLGGPEVSFDGAALFAAHPGLTALIHGEGERPLKALLQAWHEQRQPAPIARVTLRTGEELIEGPDGPLLDDLDQIPSPFEAGLVALDRGFVYYETSRGCPYRCSFCLSARDNRVRSYSMDRIKADLGWLMRHQVPKIKLVDRTFNYAPARTLELFRYILEHNRGSHFHFEIAGHLLDDEILSFLETVPAGTFQFEIGVQTTLENTLDLIDRKVNLAQLEANVQRLRRQSRVQLHLDLVAGLPGETFDSFCAGVDRVAALQPHHLQVELAKILPGSPLREDAAAHQLRYEPNPPYTVLGTPQLPYAQLQRVRTIGRLLDLLFNADCFEATLAMLEEESGSLSRALDRLGELWQESDLLRFPVNRGTLFQGLWQALPQLVPPERTERLQDALAYDFARCERVLPKRIPAFFRTDLTPDEQTWIRARVADKSRQLKGLGVKLQYFAARFRQLPGTGADTTILFFYLTETGQGMRVEEHHFDPSWAPAVEEPT